MGNVVEFEGHYRVLVPRRLGLPDALGAVDTERGEFGAQRGQLGVDETREVVHS
jgi:hypothetical protein